jgi:hypothetical protein
VITVHKPQRLKTLTANATAKVTLDEEQRIRKHAMECGLTKSEWCRQVLLEALEASQGTRLLLSEFLALRTVFLRLHADLLQGIDASDARLKAVLDRADLDKFNQAENRINTFQARRLSSAANKPEKATA